MIRPLPSVKMVQDCGIEGDEVTMCAWVVIMTYSLGGGSHVQDRIDSASPAAAKINFLPARESPGSNCKLVTLHNNPGLTLTPLNFLITLFACPDHA